MTTLFQTVVGSIGVILGLAWIVDPIRMSRYENKLRLVGVTEEEAEAMESRALIGRIGGGLLATLGAAFAIGFIPP